MSEGQDWNGPNTIQAYPVDGEPNEPAGGRGTHRRCPPTELEKELV
jgi:hypothetical protein